MFQDRVVRVWSAASAVIAILLLGYQAVATIGLVCCNNTYKWNPGGLVICSPPSMSVCDSGAPDAPTGKVGKWSSSTRNQVCTTYAQPASASWFTGSCTVPPAGAGWFRLPGDDGKNPPSCCWVQSPVPTTGPPYGTTEDCKGDSCVGQ